jgi:hypothetical protein
MAKLYRITRRYRSGKLQLLIFFAEFGVPLYVADNEAKKTDG